MNGQVVKLFVGVNNWLLHTQPPPPLQQPPIALCYLSVNNVSSWYCIQNEALVGHVGRVDSATLRTPHYGRPAGESSVVLTDEKLTNNGTTNSEQRLAPYAGN